jgi:hypothetical protein
MTEKINVFWHHGDGVSEATGSVVKIVAVALNG